MRITLHIGSFTVTIMRKGVMQMGNGRRARALRFAICFIVILAVMIYIAPKAC